jgi:hypothetical protein
MFDPINVGDVLIWSPTNDDCSEFGRSMGTAILICDHGPTGTRALVVNRPTPLRLRDLDLPFLQRDFDSHVLFHGGDPSGLSDDPTMPGPTVTGSHNLIRNIPSPQALRAPHSLAPHVWLHPADGLRGSRPLRPGLSCGASLRDAGAAVAAGRAGAAGFKFLHGELRFAAGGLQREWDAGLWSIADDEELALALALAGAV